jgi:hypothetical protein
MSDDKKNKDKPEAGTANAAARAEAAGGKVTFDHEGETYTIDGGDDWPREAAVAFSEIMDSAGNPARTFKYVDQFVNAVLGRAQADRFHRGAGSTTAGVNAMYQRIFEAFGVSSGE